MIKAFDSFDFVKRMRPVMMMARTIFGKRRTVYKNILSCYSVLKAVEFYFILIRPDECTTPKGLLPSRIL